MQSNCHDNYDKNKNKNKNKYDNFNNVDNNVDNDDDAAGREFQKVFHILVFLFSCFLVFFFFFFTWYFFSFCEKINGSLSFLYIKIHIHFMFLSHD